MVKAFRIGKNYKELRENTTSREHTYIVLTPLNPTFI